MFVKEKQPVAASTDATPVLVASDALHGTHVVLSVEQYTALVRVLERIVPADDDEGNRIISKMDRVISE